MALFANETEFWIQFTRNFWLDEGYANPLFDSFVHIVYTEFNSEDINCNHQFI